MHVTLANGCWWTCTCNMNERALECLDSMSVRGCHDHDPSINLVLLMPRLKFSEGFLCSERCCSTWQLRFYGCPSQGQEVMAIDHCLHFSPRVGTGCQTQVAKKHGSISTGTWLAFATTWIGGLPDLIGEVKLSAFISHKFVAIGGQGWWSILGNSHGEERIY